MPAPAQGVGVQGKGVVTRGSSTYARGMSSNPKSFLTSVTIIVDLVLSLAAQSQQVYQVMGIDGNVR